ncbi:MAG: hypothetical protein R2705_22450 [Ilumatobacteraceae bacterium]
MLETDHDERVSPRRWRAGAFGGLALVAAWLLVPMVSTSTPGPDVAVGLPADVSNAQDRVERYVREFGHGVVTVSWSCDAPLTAAGDRRTVAVVTSDVAPCPEAFAAASVIVLLDPSVSLDPGLVGEDRRVIDGSGLIPGGPGARIGCAWWEPFDGGAVGCEPDGQVTVRDSTGALTEAGAERLARLVVAALSTP